jgi:hypothetical protein
MWKWILLALAVYVLYRLFLNDRRKKAEKEANDREHLTASGEMVKDPECGAYIAADSGVTVRDGDTVHRFCSYDCRDAFMRRVESERKEAALPPEQN